MTLAGADITLFQGSISITSYTQPPVSMFLSHATDKESEAGDPDVPEQPLTASRMEDLIGMEWLWSSPPWRPDPGQPTRTALSGV